MKLYKHLYQLIISSLSELQEINYPQELIGYFFICQSLPFPTLPLPSLPAWLKTLRRNYVILTLSMCLSFLNATPAVAANLSGDLLKQPATEITVSLGNAANELKFEPNHLEFVAGKRYQLNLTNPSQLKHYFTAKDFADAIWTQKVQAGKVEIKGAIHELELKPGGEAEWVFVPLKSGSYSLRCSIAGHTEAGMIGEIAIAN